PRRIETIPRRTPIFDLVAPHIEELLREWQPRISAKQRVTGARLYEQLIIEGYQVSPSWVRKYLSARRLKNSEVFIPLQHYAGEEAQIDFFEVTVNIANIISKAWMFVMHLMYSGRDFVCIYEHCDQISFLDGHVRAFAHFGGVPQSCIYDNLKAAVAHVCLPDRILTVRFQALASHYLFETCFARVDVGHDKGAVEFTGKAIRLKYLVPFPCGQSLADINEQLLKKLDANQQRQRHGSDKKIAELFVEEKAKM
ncbi:MAG: IS21 family transposase, partial [Deltaproteobacteria bacterium]|nr:IS21 family transposase [Deltaproteobacteria bacterium]